MTIALFAPIEGDLRDINTIKAGYTRYFEQEALLAFQCWRTSGGWLKDIPIYAICPTKSGISDRTRAAFDELNVTYIEAYLSETENFSCGFWNIPLVGEWAENNLTEDILIKIDLDMYLIRPLPEELFELDAGTVVGRHGPLPFSPYLERMSKLRPEYSSFYNTGFTISKRSSGFFSAQMNALSRCDAAYSNGTFESEFGLNIIDGDDDTREDSFPYMLLEELCVSIMEREGVRIQPLDMFYLETDWDEIAACAAAGVPYDPTTIYFIHEHIDTNDVVSRDRMMNKLKYKKVLKDVAGYDHYLGLFNRRNHCN